MAAHILAGTVTPSGVTRQMLVVAVVPGVGEQVAGILVDVAAPNEPH